jgi:nucleoside-diphosphate-sugar epimerase
MRALVVGGTGPTGHFIVNGLLKRGYDVAILHTGAHEIPEIPPEVEHIHTDPYSEEAFANATGSRTFDLCIAMYGRLRSIAEQMKGKADRFVSIGGVPAYRGYMNPMLFAPAGIPTPVYEDAPRVADPEEDQKGWRIVRTEDAVFEAHPSAVHFRYPYVYGKYQLMPREWCIVRRILEKRPHIIVADGGLSLHSYGYSGNLAHAVLLGVDHSEVAAGQIYNCADEEILSVRQVIEIIATELNHDWEIVSMPWDLALPARPLVSQPLPTHRMLDLGKLRHELGYRDVVPAREAIAKYARHLAESPPERGGTEEMVLQDPFDYAAEDKLIAAWKQMRAGMPEIKYEVEPGYTLSYSGPGGRAPGKSFEK